MPHLQDSQARVLCLAGPTGAGKTALAIQLAQALGGEIVNADSRQLYADFPIITAQPSTEEQRQCPHHLYGCLATDQVMDVHTWTLLAMKEVQAIAARGHVPLLVGGTGMYFHILLHGIADIPAVPATLHDELLSRVAGEGSAALHAELARLDPVLAGRLHPNDRQRIVRGLEVALGTEHPLSWWQEHAAQAPLCAGPLLVVDTPLSELEPLLLRRIDHMIRQGALEEGRRAWERCPTPSAPGWSGIGCREICALVQGKAGLDETRSLWMKNTRAYAKRQITWFRGRRETVWIGSRDRDRALACWDEFCRA